VTRDSSLITFPSFRGFLPTFEKAFQVFWKFSLFFYCIGWSPDWNPNRGSSGTPTGVPADEPTNSLFGVHPTVTKERPSEPRQFAMDGVDGKGEENTFGRQFQTVNRNDSDRPS
jgi:hypothetical protein